MTERLHFHFSLSCIGEGNGNPLQCSCLENPRDGGAWWAAVYRVAQSRTRLRQHSSSSSIITLISQMVELLHRKVKSFAQVYTTSVCQSQGLSPNPLKLIAFRSMKCLFLTSLQLALLPSLPSQEWLFYHESHPIASTWIPSFPSPNRQPFHHTNCSYSHLSFLKK